MSSNRLPFFATKDFFELRNKKFDNFLTKKIYSDMCRINTLSMIQHAGSGHIGSSFSAMDIVVNIYLDYFDRIKDKSGVIYFSSKGHDVPGLYSVMISLGMLPEDSIWKLRRKDGLPGHPDILTPGIISNTGSLGMGISKAKGMIAADRLNNIDREYFLLLGDGELQEGQIWESLPSIVNNNLTKLTLIIDHNKIQSDTWITKVSPLGDLVKKFTSFGIKVIEIDGHDFEQITNVLSFASNDKSNAYVIIANTVKGFGVKLFEDFKKDEDFYQFHSGALGYNLFEKVTGEILSNIPNEIRRSYFVKEEIKKKLGFNYVDIWGDVLQKLGLSNPNVVVLDADLVKDTGVAKFKDNFPSRFIECGIAEQDMVSQAGGLALNGKLPIVHSFASFLSTRPHEQIRNNASEKTLIFYVGTLAGVLPSGPGHSHQAIADTLLFDSVPGTLIFEPVSKSCLQKLLESNIYKNYNSVYIRLVSVDMLGDYGDIDTGELVLGKGLTLKQGMTGNRSGLFLLGSLPVDLYLQNFENWDEYTTVAISPFVNFVDESWLISTFSNCSTVKIVYNGIISNNILKGFINIKNILKGIALEIHDIDSLPICGQNDEITQYYFQRLSEK